jgi:hypothetical protein
LVAFFLATFLLAGFLLATFLLVFFLTGIWLFPSPRLGFDPRLRLSSCPFLS